MIPPPSSPVPSASVSPAPVAAASPSRRLQTYSITGVIRVVGYGLVGMFLLDLPPVAVAYVQRPFDPQMDATLVAQILERVAVPLIAFAFIFGWEVHDLPRPERALRKLLSYLMLASSIGCLGLGALAIGSGVRQYSRAATVLDVRANQRAGVLTQLGKQLNTVSGETLKAAYLSVVHPDAARPLPPPAQMRQEIAAAMPGAIDGLYVTARIAKSQGRRSEIVSMGKYALDGLISAALFFVLWEASYQARVYRIFRVKDAPGLGVESAVIGGLGKMGRKIEGIRIFPNLEDYSWYRRLRRKLRRRKDKRDH